VRVGSLFTGYGGLDMAVINTFGGEVAWYSEIDKAACQVLAVDYPEIENLGDITKVDWSAVSPVDIITGGYPCQPFSAAGNRKGKNDDRHLWPYVALAIDALRPRLCILENVRGHLTLGFGDVLADISRMGYDARWGLVRASDAGAPHGRARIFIVAYSHNAGWGEHGGTISIESQYDSAKHLSDTTADANGTGGKAWSNAGPRREQLWLQSLGSAAPAANSDSDGHGRELHAGGMGSMEGAAAGGASERKRAWGQPDPGSDIAARNAALSNGQHDSKAEWQTRNRYRPIDTGTDLAATDADSDGCGQARRTAETQEGRTSATDSGCDRVLGPVDWGKYGPAIARWESITRPAPAPTIYRGKRPRLSPSFVEWMMGLPAGHVTGHGLRPAQELKMLGNGVCPQQAELALRMITAP
jgi:DNA (cytosine-5)-methyltransferase 1